MSYAAKLQKLCVLKGVDQATLARAMGLSRSSVSRILSGAQEPKLSLALRLSRFFDVSLEYLADEAVAIDANPRSAHLNDDEWTLLKVIRRLGTNVAMDRLLAVEQLGIDLDEHTAEPGLAS